MTGHPEDNEVHVVRGCPTPDELAAAIVAVRLMASRKTASRASSLAGRLRRQNALRSWPAERGRGAWRRSNWL